MNSIKELSEDIDNLTIIRNHYVENPEICRYKLNLDKQNITILTQNIRSINKNLDDFSMFLHRLSFEIDVIVLTECWLNRNHHTYSLPGYNYHCSKKYLNQNDGIVIFTNTNLRNITVSEPSVHDASCLTLNLNNELLLIAIYRSPSFHNIEPFINSLDNILLNTTYPINILTGDMNIDIKTNNVDRNSESYLNTMSAHGFYSAYFHPTRLRNCLDHIFIKSKREATAVVCQSGTTDHDAAMISVRTSANPPSNSKLQTKLNYTQISELIKNTDWSFLYNQHDSNIAAEYFVNTLKRIILDCQIKLKITHKKNNLKPWITSSLMKCIRKRDYLHKLYRRNPNDINKKVVYLNYRNICNYTLRNLKNKYEKELLERHKNNPKQTWTALKSICNLGNSKNNNLELLDIKDTPQHSLNTINKYFSTIGNSLAHDILIETNKTEAELENEYSSTYSTPFSFYMTPTNPDEILKLISSLKTDGAPGTDLITAKIIKNSKEYLAKPISFIINQSISSGTVPNVFKHALVYPLFKSGDPKDISNYRPISLLSVVGKLLEKVVNYRFLSYLENKNLLSENQFGFRAGRSTEDAINLLGNYISEALDQKKKSIGVFLDLKKAFDTVSTPILIKKLETLGIRGTPLSWFRDYLSNRTQAVKVGEVLSDHENCYFGIPQGSVLGPSLFLVYINDLCQIKTSAKILTFADDTVLLFKGSTWASAKATTEKGLAVISKWLQSNLLTLNITKTKYLCFHITHKNRPSDSLNIKLHTCSTNNFKYNCNCKSIDRTEDIKYLGITVDSNLNWHKHIEGLSPKIRKLMYIFKKLRGVAGGSLLKTVYFTLCQSVISYSITAWGGACKTSLLTLEKCQRAVLKVALNKPMRYPTKQLYIDANVLTVRQLFIMNTTLRFHRTSLISIPSHKSNRVSRHDLWKSPPTRTKFAQHFNRFLAPYLYTKINKLLNIKNLTRYQCKKHVYKWLTNNDYNSTEDFLTIMT